MGNFRKQPRGPIISKYPSSSKLLLALETERQFGGEQEE